MRFRKGSRVEVLSLNAPSYGAWRTAEILSGNGHTYSVRYYSFGLAKDETLEERVARKMIRPCPPITDVYRWESGELVEVLDHVFWKPATVLKELSGRCYAVRLLGVAVELTVHKVNIRARQAWEDERWVMIEKVSCSVKSSTLTGSDVNQNLKPYERSVVSVRLLKRPSPCESAESCTGTPKKMRSTEESNGYRQTVRVRSKRFSDDECSVGSCSPIRYDDESTSFLDGSSSSQEADSCSSDAESSEGCSGGGEARRSCRPELSTYRSTLGKLFAQGPLNWDQEASLTDLRLSLNISTDEHLMEIRNLTSAGACWPYFPCKLLRIFLFQEGSYSDLCRQQNGRMYVWKLQSLLNRVAMPGACRSCLLLEILTLMHWVYRIVLLDQLCSQALDMFRKE
ncbi:Plant Tudor-like RNA-binding protein [Raphanus sativus]|nr:Plant Tudor-like RNA-binding protein [Raphanus sativus]